MIAVYQGSDYFEAQLLAGLMEQAGLQVFLQGVALQGGLGDLPALGHLSITVDDADHDCAVAIVQAYEQGDYALQDED
ncbi:MAG: putative signal transducing protein [Porticoccaceae bacterium]